MIAVFSSGKSRKLWQGRLGFYSGGGSSQVGKAVCVEHISFDLALTRKPLTLTY